MSPSELTRKRSDVRPSSAYSPSSNEITSTSAIGSSVPRISTPELVVLAEASRLRTLVAEHRATYQALKGDTGWCCTKARTTEAVPSGRRAICRPPRSVNSYISLVTTSEESPELRRNTSASSKPGLTTRPKPNRSAQLAKRPTSSVHRALSGGRMSWVPFGDWKLGMAVPGLRRRGTSSRPEIGSW